MLRGDGKISVVAPYADAVWGGKGHTGSPHASADPSSPSDEALTLSNPVLVEVLRGSHVESRHRGAVAVTDADGDLVLSLGDVETPVFPRSAIKAIQSLPLVESGAADRFGLDDADLALACASHSGEPVHVGVCAKILHKAGCSSADLECGTHRPLGEAAMRLLLEAGDRPGPMHNNCSGKHAGFICIACHLGLPSRGYVRADHPVQREVTAAIGDLTGMAMGRAPSGIDGCAIPAYAIPLRALARAFARMGTGHGLAPERAKAAARLRAAVTANPHMVAGTRRLDTVMMEALGTRAFTKTGAEGVFCAALPERGLGIAIKCDDGAGRAAELAIAAVVRRFLELSMEEHEQLEDRFVPILHNWNGEEVGRIRATAAIAE